ncbi:MAG: FAD-dependent oxidoreductase [Alphaproteobacteria bacterium]|nr:FAD-dependent oxidoreductase [Alphaproteobacteria bacterium]
MNFAKSHFYCDVVVVGGGLAALSAAISAVDNGATVLLVNKGITGKSGSSAKAAGILAAAFGHGDLQTRPVPDNPFKHARDTLDVGYNIGDPKLVNFVAEQATSAIRWLENLGVEFSRAEDGGYIQLNAPGNSCPRAVSAIGGGHAIVSALLQQAKARGVMFLDETIVRDIKPIEGHQFLVTLQGHQATSITAGAAVLAAGGATGLFPTVSGDEGNIGTSIMLGYDIGAALKNLEFVEFTLIYRVKSKILRIAGMAPFLSRGGKLTNSLGEDLLELHFPNKKSEQIGRAEVLRLVEQEIFSNKGPIYLDCTHFSDVTWKEFEGSQGTTTLDKLTEAGCDYRTEMIEVIPAAHSVLAGIATDTNAQTSIPGVFAAGENATGIHGAGRLSGNGLTACVVMGRTAGLNAIGYARNAPRQRQNFVASKALSSKQLNRSLNIIEGQSQASNTNIEIKALMDRVKNIVGNNLGIIRNEMSLTEGQKQLSKLWLEIKDLGEQDRDVFELKQMARLASLMIEAASRRTESRGVQFRSDFNALDDAWAKTQTLIKD